MANILEEVQSYVAGKLSAEQSLSACPFIAENKKDIEYEIKNALGKQGIVGVVMTPKALYAGKFEDQSLVWQLDELEIDIIENVTVNRGKKSLSSYMTGQDAAMAAFEALCPLSGESEGQFQAVSYEEGEDNGLLVNKCVFKCLVHGGAEEPEPSPEPLQFSVVKLFAEEPPLSVTRKDGWLWPSGDQFILWSHNSPNALGDVTTKQMSAFVTQKLGSYYTKAETSSAVEISSALADYYKKSETSSAAEISTALDSKADKTQFDSYYKKSETSSAAQINAAVAQLCSYTDSQVSSKAAKSQLSNYLPLSGGTVSGMTEFNDVVKLRSYIEVSGVTESPQFNLVDWDEDQAVVARLLSAGTVQLEDSAQHRAVLSVRDGGTVAYVEDILEQVSSYYTKNETSSAAEISAALEAASSSTQEVSSSLSAFYQKNETSSAAEIETALENVSESLTAYYTKSETSSAAELSAAAQLKQDKLTEQQLKRIGTDCIPLMVSSLVEVSGNNYLDFNCHTRFNNYAVFNGAVDTVQMNLRDDRLDTAITLSVASEQKLLAVGGFNRELTANLNIKNGDIAYTSDIDEAVSSLAAKSELSSGLALKADISSVQSQLSGKLDKSGGTVSWLGVGRPEQRIAADQQKLGYVFSIDEYGSALLLPQRNVDVNLLMPSADGTLATLGDLSAAVSSVVSSDIDYMYDGLPDISAAADWSIAAVMQILRTAVLRWQQRHPDKVAPFVPPEPDEDEP